MNRLKRFEGHRYVGDRRTMRVYDCDDPGQLEELETLVSDHDLWANCQLQTFAPDELIEAANRSFRPPR